MVGKPTGKPTCYASPRLVGRRCAEKGGHGVYAVGAIRRGELLVVFAGSAVEASEIPLLAPDQRRLLLQVEEGLYLLSEVEGWADWVNHCCEPNAGLRGQVSLVAMRDIQPGEEICYDYAMSDGSGYDDFDCRCGAASCRHRVSGDDWMKEDLWERYRGYFSPYLAERIERLRSARAAAARAGDLRPARARRRRAAAG
ncbi:MAG TPA: SET domain-containing protein [Kofleriaceae bacterium]|nr:SET domain-containing protein [Kofleriaceae bacterium]